MQPLTVAHDVLLLHTHSHAIHDTYGDTDHIAHTYAFLHPVSVNKHNKLPDA
jgi:hypothetical protein